MSTIEIDGRRIGPGEQAYIVAEAETNYLGDMSLAKTFIEEAATAGADAIKFQTIDRDADMSRSGMEAVGKGDLYERVADSELSRAEHEELIEKCDDEDITFLSTPFSAASVELLDDVDAPAIKIGSGELTDFNILRRAAETGRPLVVSTGMADFDTVARVDDFLSEHAETYAFLYCVSLYPTDPSQVALGVVDEMREAFGVPVGFSDHTTGIEVSGIAAERGADIIENHFTLDRRLPGSDPDVTIEPDELAELVEIASLSAATGGTDKPIREGEREVAEWAHHSIVAAEPLSPGDRLTRENTTTKRPGTGIPAADYFDVLGRTVGRPVDEDTVLTESDLE